MKRLLVVLGVGALLSACSGLIPPVSIGADPFGLDGKESASVALSAQAIAVGKADATATFEDITQTIPINPSKLEIQLSVKDVKLTGSGCPSPLPSSVKVTVNAKMTVSDGSGTSARSTSASANGLSFDYATATKTVSNFNSGLLSFNASEVLAIVQNGGTNTAVLSADVSTDSTPSLAGCNLSVVWGKGAGTVRF